MCVCVYVCVCVCVCVCLVLCLFRVAYGSLVAMDPYIWAPNGMGMAACAVQLGLFGIYGFAKPAEAEAKKEHEE